jgi:hypothetical protein
VADRLAKDANNGRIPPLAINETVIAETREVAADEEVSEIP